MNQGKIINYFLGSDCEPNELNVSVIRQLNGKQCLEELIINRTKDDQYWASLNDNDVFSTFSTAEYDSISELFDAIFEDNI